MNRDHKLPPSGRGAVIDAPTESEDEQRIRKEVARHGLYSQAGCITRDFSALLALIDDLRARLAAAEGERDEARRSARNNRWRGR